MNLTLRSPAQRSFFRSPEVLELENPFQMLFRDLTGLNRVGFVVGLTHTQCQSAEALFKRVHAVVGQPCKQIVILRSGFFYNDAPWQGGNCSRHVLYG